jgi:hypothetical protein
MESKEFKVIIRVMKLRFLLNKLGQTSVEYLLMLVVSIGLGLTFFKKFEGYLLTNPNSYMNIQMEYYKALYDPAQGLKKYRLPR